MYIGQLSKHTLHPDNPVLDGILMSDSLLAEDIMLPSTTIAGLQFKLDKLYTFFNELHMKVNTNQSKILRLGCVRNQEGVVPHTFGVNGEALEEVTQFKYVGFNVVGGRSAPWQTSPFLDKCIHKARTVATSLLQLRSYVRPSNADFMMRLWHNLVNPYFVFGAKVSFDSATKGYESVMDQVLLQYMRSAMGVPPKSIRILPLLDNAIFEVRHRRKAGAYCTLCGIRMGLQLGQASSTSFDEFNESLSHNCVQTRMVRCICIQSSSSGCGADTRPRFGSRSEEGDYQANECGVGLVEVFGI